jgi:glycosyltransferase involved in cell wall biosynthesis
VAVSRLTVLRHGSDIWRVSGVETTTSVDRLRRLLRGGTLVTKLFGYDEARLLTHRLETIGRPLKLGLLLRALSRGRCYVEDDSGRTQALSLPLLARWTWRAAREPFLKPQLLASVAKDIQRIERQIAGRPTPPVLDLTRRALYLRTDISVALKAGGSVGHIAGVLNHLDELTGPPIFLTIDAIPTVRPDIEIRCVTPLEEFWEYPELPTLVNNRAFAAAAADIRDPLSLVYQRYSLNNFTGAALAAGRRLPFVLEYNGSEIWMSRHWGYPLEHEALSERIEMLNLAAADVIVVVSSVMADELSARGVGRERILVNPNGVEPEVYSPAVDGGPLRERLGFDGRTVIGFIGTFGPWHGAEVLAEAFGRLIAADPALRRDVRLLMIGDGARMPDVRAAIARHGIDDLVTLTGIVPQADGPRYLAACDILASPHVPNADGSPFFGSPTKLFEYMAMGKGIVASELDQIGEILEHGRAAVMVTPGDADALAAGLRALVHDPERRAALGREARRLAVERHSWRSHAARIVDALRARLPAA